MKISEGLAQPSSFVMLREPRKNHCWAEIVENSLLPVFGMSQSWPFSETEDYLIRVT